MYTYFTSGQKKTFLSELTSSLLASLLTLENLLLLNKFASSMTLVDLSLLNGLLPRSDWDLISVTGEVITASFCLNARDIENILSTEAFLPDIDIDNCIQIPDVTELLPLKENSHRSPVILFQVIHPGGFSRLLLPLFRVLGRTFLLRGIPGPEPDLADVLHIDDGHPDG